MIQGISNRKFVGFFVVAVIVILCVIGFQDERIFNELQKRIPITIIFKTTELRVNETNTKGNVNSTYNMNTTISLGKTRGNKTVFLTTDGISTASTVTASGTINVVVTIPGLSVYKSGEYPGITQKQINDRQTEYMESLNRTSQDQSIKKVYVLHKEPDVPETIRKQKFPQISKIEFVKIDKPFLSVTAFKFVYEKLQGEVVMLVQADVYVGKGFHLIDKNILQKHNLAYALTRHGTKERLCNMSGSCSKKVYQGSHDAYIFVPKGPIPPKALELLNLNTNSWGIDNVNIWVLQHVMKFRVLNPCLTLITYHNHCSGVRNNNRIRVNNKYSGVVGPSDKLM